MSRRTSGDAACDERAFEALYEARYEQIVRTLLHMGADPDDAQDVANEAMLRAWRERAQFTSPDHARAWTVRVAQNLLVSHFRRSTRELVSLEDVAEAAWAEGDHAVGGALQSERRRRIAAALATLTPMDREVAIETLFHGTKISDLAERWHKSPGSLRTRKWRARERLRDLLHDLRGVPPFPLVARRKAPAVRDGGASWMPHAHAPLHMVSVLLTVMSVVVGPFDGPLGPIPRARADAGTTTPETRGGSARTTAPARTRLPAARDRAAAAMPPAADRAAPRLRPHRPPDLPVALVVVCVDGICTPGKEGDPAKDRTVLTVHLPMPVGDRQATVNVGGVCEWVPDAEPYDCHTEGDPDRSVPTPPPLP